MEDKIFGRDKVKELKDQKIERINYILHIFESLRHKNHIRKGDSGPESKIIKKFGESPHDLNSVDDEKIEIKKK